MPTSPPKNKKVTKPSPTGKTKLSKPASASRTTKPVPPALSATGKLPQVRVRMYRQGLGDCFLVTFNVNTPNEKHMLVDCGTLGSRQGIQMKDVVADIQHTTKNHINLLIATHEHKDHVSGFGSYQDKFKEIQVDNVWMAWTEDAKDPLAQKLAKNRDDLAIAAAAATRSLKASPDPVDQQLGTAVEDLLGFSGFGAAGELAKTIDEAMDFVRNRAPARFFKPGGPVIEENWLPGFRFYVLGPPYSQESLHDTGEHGSAELYGMAATLAASFPEATTQISVSSGLDTESEMPFDRRFRIKENDPAMAASLAGYRAPSEAWRRVETTWLNAGATLALQLDSLTNNTSLAIAIERVADGKVLLFPGDAQEGNLLSWHNPEMKWKVSSSSPAITASDLLQRTVFYKVGHHASRNATAKGKGLELMTSQDELVAFIPVDREVALGKSPQGSWRMPARELYRALLQKCQGRVIRADIFWADDATNAANKEIEKEFLNLFPAQSWKQWKQQQAAAESAGIVSIPTKKPILYIDYFLK